MYVPTSIPLVSRTRAIFRSAEFGFLGVIVDTRVHTPRFCGAPWSAGVFVFAAFVERPLRINWLTVGNESPKEEMSRYVQKAGAGTSARAEPGRGGSKHGASGAESRLAARMRPPPRGLRTLNGYCAWYRDCGCVRRRRRRGGRRRPDTSQGRGPAGAVGSGARVHDGALGVARPRRRRGQD